MAPFSFACMTKRKAIGWFSAMLEPITSTQSALARSHCGIVAAPRPKVAPRLGTELLCQTLAWFSMNTGAEPQKSGIARDEARDFLRACREEHGLAVSGLMCIPPEGEDPVPHFRWLAEFAAKEGLGTLSMGMSGDFESAIACGATQVRVGSAIFGARPYPAQAPGQVPGQG